MMVTMMKATVRKKKIIRNVISSFKAKAQKKREKKLIKINLFPKR